MNKVEKIFGVHLWEENPFDPSKHQRGDETAEVQAGRWGLMDKIEELLQRITGIFWSDRAAKTQEDLGVVAAMWHYYEELKGCEKRLTDLEKQMAGKRVPEELKGVLIEARRDWERVRETLQLLKSSYGRHPRITKTASYQRLNSMEEVIEERIQKFMYTSGDEKAATELKSAQDFAYRFYLNREIFSRDASLLIPAQKHLELLDGIVECKSREFENNPFNKDLQAMAKKLKENLRQEVIETFLDMRSEKVHPDVKKFVAVHANPAFTIEIKSLMRFALNALRRDQPDAYKRATQQIDSLKEEAYLEFLSSLFKSYVEKRHPDIGLQNLYAKAEEDLEDLRKIPIQQCLQHTQAAVAGLREAPHLLAAIEELALVKSQRRELMDRIQPAGHVDNLLLLAEVVQSPPQALIELDFLQKKALEVRFDGLSQIGKTELDRLQNLVGEHFPIPLTEKLALISCLYDADFCMLFTKLLDNFLLAQQESISNDFRLGIKRERQEPFESWNALIAFLSASPHFSQKMVALGPFWQLLAAKVGLNEPFTLAENIVRGVLEDAEMKAEPSLGRPLRGREAALKALSRYSKEEQQLWQISGMLPGQQLGCFEFFACRRGERPSFSIGYALPGMGMAVGEVNLDLSTFRDLEPVRLFRFIKSCLDIDEEGLEQLFNQTDYLVQLDLLRQEQLKETIRTLKRDSDRLLRGAYMALGNPKIQPPEEVQIIPWEILVSP